MCQPVVDWDFYSFSQEKPCLKIYLTKKSHFFVSNVNLCFSSHSPQTVFVEFLIEGKDKEIESFVNGEKRRFTVLGERASAASARTGTRGADFSLSEE